MGSSVLAGLHAFNQLGGSACPWQ